MRIHLLGACPPPRVWLTIDDNRLATMIKHPGRRARLISKDQLEQLIDDLLDELAEQPGPITLTLDEVVFTLTWFDARIFAAHLLTALDWIEK